MMWQFHLYLSIAWSMSSDIQGRGHVCEGIKQTVICKRLLFWPGFQIGYQGLLSLSSALLFTVCKSSIWIYKQRLSLLCYFCSQIQNHTEASWIFFPFTTLPFTSQLLFLQNVLGFLLTKLKKHAQINSFA